MIGFDPAMLLGKTPSATNMLAAGAGTLLGGLRRQAAARMTRALRDADPVVDNWLRRTNQDAGIFLRKRPLK
jgi:hypothetical protein